MKANMIVPHSRFRTGSRTTGCEVRGSRRGRESEEEMDKEELSQAVVFRKDNSWSSLAWFLSSSSLSIRRQMATLKMVSRCQVD
jgi:hypothetical protein